MIGALACDPRGTFGDLCAEIARKDPSGIAGPVVEHLLGPLVVFVILIVLGRTGRRLLERGIDRAGGDRQVRSLVHNIVTAATYLLAAMAGLVAGGLDIGVLLTFGGLASLAVGLAFQDVLRNLLAGIFLLIEKPFRIGDVILVDPHTGTVQTIQLRTTTLRTADGRIAILPNLTAFNSIVVNQSALASRRCSVRLRVPASADLDEAMRRIASAVPGVAGVASHPVPELIPHLDVENAVVIDCRFWVDHREFDADTVTTEVARRSWAAAREPADSR